MAEKISLKIKLAGREYPLKVSEDDKDTILAIVEDLNTKVNDFEQMYKRNDKQDYLAMLLVNCAVEKQANIGNNTGTNDIETTIEEIDSLLDSLF